MKMHEVRYYWSYKRLEAYLFLKIPLNGMMKAIICCAFPVPLQACVILPYTFFLKEHQFIYFLDLAVLGVGLNMISPLYKANIYGNILENAMQYIE